MSWRPFASRPVLWRWWRGDLPEPRGVWWDVGADWQGDGIGFPDARNGFQVLWDSLNAKRGYDGNANPWVWVIEFRRVDEQRAAP